MTHSTPFIYPIFNVKRFSCYSTGYLWIWTHAKFCKPDIRDLALYTGVMFKLDYIMILLYTCTWKHLIWIKYVSFSWSTATETVDKTLLKVGISWPSKVNNIADNKHCIAYTMYKLHWPANWISLINNKQSGARSSQQLRERLFI